MHCVQAHRWTTQRNMIDSLLLLKASVVEYFRLHASDKRKLFLRDWSVTNEVCSVLDPTSEVNIKVQGAQSTFISHATFLMRELLEVMSGSKVRIRAPDCPRDDPVPYDNVEQTAVYVCVEYMGKKNFGEAGKLWSASA